MILSLILAATITGGEVGTFISFPAMFDQNVDAEHTPGGDDWYVYEDTVKVPKDFVVTRNGVVTNVPQPYVVGTSETNDWWLIIAEGVAPEDELDGDCQNKITWRPGSFDMSWRGLWSTNEYMDPVTTYYYAWATNWEERPLSYRHWFAKSARSLGKLAPAVLSLPFEAYYERLYYASKSSQMNFDEDKWGPRDAGIDFAFNTNIVTQFYDPIIVDSYLDFVQGGSTGRCVKSTRRFIGDTVKNLKNLKILLNEMLTDSNLRYNNPGFIYRPGWILDGMGLPNSNCDPYHGSKYDDEWGPYWASSDPKLNLTDGLIPQFDWIENPLDINKTPIASLWMSNCVTMAMFYPSSCFKMEGRNPLTNVVNAVNFGNMNNVEDVVRPAPFVITLEEALTNVFPRSALHELDNPGESLNINSYKAFYDEPNRRLNMRHFCGVNQILSCMDRMIYFPSYHSNFYTVRYTVRKTSNYESSCTVNYDPIMDELTILEDVNKLDWSLKSYSCTTTTNNSSGHGNIFLDVSENTTSASGGGINSSFIDLYVTADDIEEILISSGHQGIDCDVELINITDTGFDGYYYLIFKIGDDLHYMTKRFLVDAIAFDVDLTSIGVRSYSYEVTISNKVEVGQVHEQNESEGRAASCKFGIMSGIMTADSWTCDDYEEYWKYDSGKHPLYKSVEGTYSTKSTLIEAIRGQLLNAKQKIDSESFVRLGGQDYSDPDSMMDYVTAPHETENPSVAIPTLRTYVSSGFIFTNCVWHVDSNFVITPDDPAHALPYNCGTANAEVEVMITEDPADRKKHPAMRGSGESSFILSTDWNWKTLKKE